MPAAAVVPWIQYDEDVVGEAEPNGVTDVSNRPLKFIMTQSQLADTDVFPGFVLLYQGIIAPEGITTAPQGSLFVNTVGNTFFIKRSGALATGWRQLVGAYSSATDTNSIEVGVGATVSALNGIAIGRNTSIAASSDFVIVIGDGAVVTGTVADGSIVIGKLASSNADSAVVIGNGASTATGDSVTVGHSAITSLGSNVAIGMSANSAGASGSSKNVAVGASSTTGGWAGCTAVGGSSTANATNASAFGGGAIATGVNSTAVGNGANTGGFSHSIAFGLSATNTTANQCVIGSTTSIINTLVVGAGNSVNAPQNVIIRTSHGSGSDIAGSTLFINAGLGTGTAAGATIKFQTGDPGVSGVTLQTYATKFTIAPTAITAAVRVDTVAATNALGAGLRLPHGVAPGAPVNGDIWTTTTGLFVRINGVTVGPLT